MSEDTQLLIERFWAGTTSSAERQRLVALLGPDETAWTERLRQEFAEYPANEEFADSPDDGPLTTVQSARVLLRLRWHLDAEAALAAPRRLSWERWAAAAMVLLVSGLAMLRLAYQPTTSPTVARVPVSAVSARQLVRRANAGPAPLHLALPDGSAVALQPGSEVDYYAPFGQGERNVSLRGTALFAVAKDAAHPFTVLANGFTTTALGTKFRVQATDSQQVQVQLLEGRVVVRATPASHLTMREHFLTPGQELTVSRRTRQVRVRRLGPEPGPPAKPLTVEVPTGLAFEKDDLTSVFAQVGERYHVRVAYDSADVRGLTFSGSFAATDALPVVLSALCKVNNLKFTQRGDQVIIRKTP